MPVSKIFISYRRDDTKYQVDRIKLSLSKFVASPSNSIFVDIEAIPLGVDFRSYISSKVSECEIILAVIGKNWIGLETNKTRRLDAANDLVRAEVAAGLKRGIPVAPILIDDAELPAIDDMPHDLVQLPSLNGTRLRRESFEHDVEKLAHGLGLKELPEKPILPMYPELAEHHFNIICGHHTRKMDAIKILSTLQEVGGFGSISDSQDVKSFKGTIFYYSEAQARAARVLANHIRDIEVFVTKAHTDPNARELTLWLTS
jgi:hypothetical protein